MTFERVSPSRLSPALCRFLVLGGVVLLLSGGIQRVHAGEPAGTNTTSAIELTNLATRIRPYVHLRSGEFDTVWGVQDMWGFSVGADLNRHVGLELAFDSYEKDFDPFGTKIGEESLLSLAPQVRLRLPLVHDRVVPYVVAGAGIGWYDYNDPTQDGFGTSVDAQGTELVITAGVGVDLFINDNVAFNLEGKYIWLDQLNISVDGQAGTFDMADFVGTFGFRAYLDDTTKLKLFDVVEEPPIRIYFGAGFGGAVITDGNWVPGVTLVPESASIGTVGESVELALGFNFGRHFSFEIPVDYYESVIQLDSIGGVSGGVGEYATYALIPSMRFRYPMMNGKIAPYLLAGFGGTYGEVNDRYEKPIYVTVDSKGFAPAFAVGGGIEYYFNRDVSLFGQVKYIQSWNNQIDVNGMGEESGDLSWLHFQIGFRLNLLSIGNKAE
ncbi:MAG: porin family protein [Verrucomicrobia bacterium]|jgi:opacity protein-like surface antigen|nr:porin family protein [Verrucomicrobiota bacterium]